MSWIDYLESHLFTCTLKAVSGLDCPGCGLQRAAIALARGDLYGSLCYNASLIPLLFTLFFAAAHLLFGFRQGARTIVWLFAFTAGLMLLQYLVKFFSNH